MGCAAEQVPSLRDSSFLLALLPALPCRAFPCRRFAAACSQTWFLRSPRHLVVMRTPKAQGWHCLPRASLGAKLSPMADGRSRTLLWVLIGGGAFFLFVLAVFSIVYLTLHAGGGSRLGSPVSATASAWSISME